jgi:hypothetical protein
VIAITASPGEIQRACALLAAALSDGRRDNSRLVTGEHRAFGLNSAGTVVNVPYPNLDTRWTARTITCGIALQCAPSKDRLAGFALHELSDHQQLALVLTESRAALGWIAATWPGLLPACEHELGDLGITDPEIDGAQIVEQALELARSRQRLTVPALLGRLRGTPPPSEGRLAAIRRAFGRMPWTSRLRASRRIHSIPVGGDGGIQNPNLPPPSRPEDEELEVRPDERVGIPYPEWNMWSHAFLSDHVAVLERRTAAGSPRPSAPSPEVRRWFEEHTHRVMRTGLADGSDLDIGRYVDHFIDSARGSAPEPRIFRDLLPSHRDVTTALLLDGSSSLGAHHGQIFELELTCADWLSQAMSATRERHGVFVFTGNTRHRVEIRCLKDFDEARSITPSGLGLVTGGYTRLGAPIRHLTSRLLRQPSERRLLILIGDGLMCDEGYEGRYAWADVAHAVEEADDAGVAIFYIGVGATRVDPLPEVFGPRRSERIRRVEELPRVLARVHRELVAA